MGMRVMSKKSASMVYHRPECKYARVIYKRNWMRMEWEDAELKGYRPCKCCDGASFIYKLELEKINNYAKIFNMDVNFKDNKIYVRTDVGCWKIVYKIKNQRFILLHRNYVNGRIGLNEVEKVPFHRQGDMPESGSIMKYLRYIKGHDDFIRNIPADYRQMPQDTKKHKKYYKAAKKRAQRKYAKRLDRLFVQIENQYGIKKLSFC